MDRAVKIEVEIKDEKVVLRLRGAPARGEPSQVQDKVNDLLREGYKDFTVDWNDVYIDSAVLGVLVRLCASVSTAGGRVVIAGPKRLRDLLALTSLLDKFDADAPERIPDPFAPFAPDVRWRLHAVAAFGIVVVIVIMFWRLAGIFGGQ